MAKINVQNTDISIIKKNSATFSHPAPLPRRGFVRASPALSCITPASSLFANRDDAGVMQG